MRGLRSYIPLTAFSLVVLVLLNSACQSPFSAIRPVTETFTTNSAAPGKCRILGSVVSVLQPNDPNNVPSCENQSCNAKIRIEQVIAYGPGFSSILNVGDTIRGHFVYAVKSRGRAAADNPLPKIKGGSIIRTDIEQRMEVGPGVTIYFIYGYRKVK